MYYVTPGQNHCTAVLESDWGQQRRISTADIAAEQTGQFEEPPQRLTRIEMIIIDPRHDRSA
jgi:hypothetical protein